MITYLLIKPDAIWRRLDRVIGSELQRKGLEIIYRKNIYVDRQIYFGIWPKEDEWVPRCLAYIGSVNLPLFIVRGGDVILKTLELKRHIREEYCQDEWYADKWYMLYHCPDNDNDLWNELPLVLTRSELIRLKYRFPNEFAWDSILHQC
jgi:hypothetical protein